MKFTYDLRKPQMLWLEDRTTVSGNETTMFTYIPAKGCPNDCFGCSIKHTRAENYTPSPESSKESALAIAGFLSEHREVDTLKIFNGGNILRGTEFGSLCEVHESFWSELATTVSSSGLRALELEVRLDDLSMEESVKDRVIEIQSSFGKIGIELRLILAFEYSDDEVINAQSKFSSGNFRTRVFEAIGFLAENDIPYLCYAMFGGGFPDRPFTPAEAVKFTASTINYAFGLSFAPREVIVNCQYLDPFQQWAEVKTGRRLWHVPTESDFRRLLRVIRLVLVRECRMRISYLPEDTIVGTIGPNLSHEFMSLLDGFNQADDQEKYLKEVIPGL